jgi:hypothetical protein
VTRSASSAQAAARLPPWLQEVVLRCLEIDPVWRHPTASQLAFELGNPDQIKLTARSERLQRDPVSTVWRRRFNRGLTQPSRNPIWRRSWRRVRFWLSRSIPQRDPMR